MTRAVLVALALVFAVGCAPAGFHGYAFQVTFTIDPDVLAQVSDSDGVIGYASRYPDGTFSRRLESVAEFQRDGLDDPAGFPDGNGPCERHQPTLTRDFMAYAGPQVIPDYHCDTAGSVVQCNTEETQAVDPFQAFQTSPIAVSGLVTATAGCSDFADTRAGTPVTLDLALPSSG